MAQRAANLSQAGPLTSAADPYARKFVPPPTRRVDAEPGELPPAVKRRKKHEAASTADDDPDE
jgi:hypothetical protein